MVKRWRSGEEEEEEEEGSSATAFPKTEEEELDPHDDGYYYNNNYNPPPQSQSQSQSQSLLLRLREEEEEAAPSSSSSSSSSHLRAYFIGMGYSPSLVDSVIAHHKGQEEDVELILDALIHSSSSCGGGGGLGNSTSDSLFDDQDTTTRGGLHNSTFIQPKEELDVLNSNKDDKRASLFEMEFSPKDIEFAMSRLGEDAPFEEIVDFIIAAQNSDNSSVTEVGSDKDATNETLFSTMEKTISLLKMGFSENDISSVIEKYGSDLSFQELAEAICAVQRGECYHVPKKQVKNDRVGQLYGNLEVKSENSGLDAPFELVHKRLNQSDKGKRPKQSDTVSQLRHFPDEENYGGRKRKQECTDHSSSFFEPSWVEEKVNSEIPTFGKRFSSGPCKSLDGVIAKPPYFFYGDVLHPSFELWQKASEFLYSLEPEFVDTQFFSALSRKEGYIHNLPKENRFHVLTKSPSTLYEALPHTKKWWPAWDTRKHLTDASYNITGLSTLCQSLERTLIDTRGPLSSEQRKRILGYCGRYNLVWVGPQKLGPIEPEQLELILGYPVNHTACECSMTERLQLLRDSFQIDTLGFHLSVLKSIFPGGVTVLSVFSGIGGAVVALSRLGIRLNAVVSIETCEMKRKILKTWWQNSRQSGQLEQIEDIHKLNTNRIEKLIDKFGEFDLVICQNSFSPSLKGTDPAFDFTSFHEFVRVLQRVRGLVKRDQ